MILIDTIRLADRPPDRRRARADASACCTSALTGRRSTRCSSAGIPGEPRARQALPAIGGVLRRYFGGDVGALDTVPVELNGTPFQKTVWQALRRIPCGTTISYAELARRIGDPAAVRAVGTANGANPVAVIVPCHRVIGSNGNLTGYGGGLDRKQWLLEHEGVVSSPASVGERLALMASE